jgi:hypothetical protein
VGSQVSPPRAVEAGEATARRASDTPWAHALARAGLTARGLIYLLIAVLAAQVALGRRGNSADQRGALQQISGEPFGRIALVVLAAGFAAYAAWRLLTTVTGEPGTPDDDSARQVAQRVAAAVQGAVYAGLCAMTVALLAGSGAGESGEHPAGWTARLLALPAGRLLVMAVGAGVVVGGLALVWWALRDRFEEHLVPGSMGPVARRWAIRLGVAGYVSRGVVVALVGASLVQAAATHDPGRARGLDDTLSSVAAQPLGSVLLLLTALGLLAFGLYSFVEARHRRLSVH